MNKVQDLKNALKSYSYHCLSKKNIISELSYLDKNIKALNFIELTTRQEQLKKELDYHVYQIERVNKALSKLSEEDKKLIKLLFFNGKRYEDICYDYYRSERGLKYYVNTILSNTLKE